GLCVHGALPRRARKGILQVLLLALARLRQCAHRHDDLDHVHQRTLATAPSLTPAGSRASSRYALIAPRTPPEPDRRATQRLLSSAQHHQWDRKKRLPGLATLPSFIDTPGLCCAARKRRGSHGVGPRG